MGKLTVAAIIAFLFLLAGLGLHVAGFVTKYWMTADRAEKSSDQSIEKINIGLWDMHQEFTNGTTLDIDSPIVKKEEQYIVLAIAVANALFCMIIIIKAVHVFVGLVSFVSVAMMLIAVFFVYTNIENILHKIQDFHTDWPELKLAYSFYLVFAGILLNIVATVIFLTLLLLREERKAARSTKGLGVCDVGVSEHSRLKSNDVLDKSHKYEHLETKTSGKRFVSQKTSSMSVISGSTSVYENMAFNSVPDSVHAGPSGEDNFNHILQSERL